MTSHNFANLFTLEGRTALVTGAGRRIGSSCAMTLARGGAIINTTSQMGHVGQTLQSVYVMATHAPEGLTKAATVLFAASPAASLVTGSTISVDGEWTAQ